MPETRSNISRKTIPSLSKLSFFSLQSHLPSNTSLISEPSFHPSRHIDNFYTRPTRIITPSQFQHMKQRQLNLDPHQKYLKIVYSCMVYVRKHGYRRIDDDGSLILEISDYVELEVDVKAKNSMGNEILKNGYFLVAYAILMGRVLKSRLMVEYLLKQFVCFFEVNKNEEDLSYYTKMYLQDKMNMKEFENPRTKKQKCKIKKHRLKI